MDFTVTSRNVPHKCTIAKKSHDLERFIISPKKPSGEAQLEISLSLQAPDGKLLPWCWKLEVIIHSQQQLKRSPKTEQLPGFPGKYMDSGIYREGMKVELTIDCRHFADRFSAKWILVLSIAPLWRSSMYVRIYLSPT